MASHSYKTAVRSDIPVHNQFIPAEHLKTKQRNTLKQAGYPPRVGGGWTKTKLMLFSTQVEVIVELKLELSLAKIKDWTTKQKMIINQKKTKVMIFNFTDKYKFTTNLNLNDENLEVVKQAKLLDVMISDNLKWVRILSTL